MHGAAHCAPIKIEGKKDRVDCPILITFFFFFTFRLQSARNKDRISKDGSNADGNHALIESFHRRFPASSQIGNILHTHFVASVRRVAAIDARYIGAVRQVGRAHVATARIDDSSAEGRGAVRVRPEFDARSAGVALSATAHVAHRLLPRQQQRQYQRFHLFE